MFVVHRLFAIRVFPRATLKKKLTVPLWGPPHWPPDYKISTPELMLCKKTSAIIYQKIGPVTPGSDPHPGCVARGAGCGICCKFLNILKSIVSKLTKLVFSPYFSAWGLRMWYTRVDYASDKGKSHLSFKTNFGLLRLPVHVL